MVWADSDGKVLRQGGEEQVVSRAWSWELYGRVRCRMGKNTYSEFEDRWWRQGC